MVSQSLEEPMMTATCGVVDVAGAVALVVTLVVVLVVMVGYRQSKKLF
jgi:hypothetical protein